MISPTADPERESPGAPSSAAIATTKPSPTSDIPSLPELNRDTTTPALLARAKELAHEHPDVPWLREYVVNAHFWVAHRAIEQSRFADAARVLDESDEWGASRGDVASFRAMLQPQSEKLERRVGVGRNRHPTGFAIRPPPRCTTSWGSRTTTAKSSPARSRRSRGRSRSGTTRRFEARWKKARRDSRTADGFNNQRLSHFIVRYEGQTMESVGRMAIDTLERNYSSLVSELGFEPSEPVAVILYTQRSYREMGGPHWSAGIYDGKIRIPVKDISWGDDHIRRTLHHELAHAFVRSKVGDNVPRWLNEGLAEYVKGTRTRTVGHRLSPLVAAGQSLENCVLGEGCDDRIVYPAAASMVDYVVQHRGMGGARDVLEGLARGDDIDACLRRTFGKDEQALVKEWEHFLRRRI